MGKHHVSICERGNSVQGNQFRSGHNGDHGGSVHSDSSSHATAAQPIGSGGSDAMQNSQAVTSPTFHVGSVGGSPYKPHKLWLGAIEGV